MVCSHCGTTAPTGSRFCGECGAPLLATDVISSNRATRPMDLGADVALLDALEPPDAALQLDALKLELSRLKLELQEVDALAAPVGGQEAQPQRKQALEQRITRLEEHILALESGAEG